MKTTIITASIIIVTLALVVYIAYEQPDDEERTTETKDSKETRK
jgi:hypothetical protein